MAKLLRQKSKILVAYGAWLTLAVPGLANISNKEEIFEKVYGTTFSTVNPEK